MILTAVLIGLNALIWGWWTYSFGTDAATYPTHATWYVYGPLAVALATTVVPIGALFSGHLRSGTPRALLRLALILSLIGFLPYACMSGGGI